MSYSKVALAGGRGHLPHLLPAKLTSHQGEGTGWLTFGQSVLVSLDQVQAQASLSLSLLLGGWQFQDTLWAPNSTVCRVNRHPAVHLQPSLGDLSHLPQFSAREMVVICVGQELKAKGKSLPLSGTKTRVVGSSCQACLQDATLWLQAMLKFCCGEQP